MDKADPNRLRQFRYKVQHTLAIKAAGSVGRMQRLTCAACRMGIAWVLIILGVILPVDKPNSDINTYTLQILHLSLNNLFWPQTFPLGRICLQVVWCVGQYGSPLGVVPCLQLPGRFPFFKPGQWWVVFPAMMSL